MPDLISDPLSRPPSMPERIAADISERITANGLEVLDKLPSITALADQYGVSKPMMREAARLLQAGGKIVFHHGKPCVVGSPGAEQLDDLFGFVLGQKRTDLMELQALREVLEIAAARAAASVATAAEHADLREHLDRYLAVPVPGDALHAADIALHAAVMRAGGNRLFAMLLDGITGLLQVSRREAWAQYESEGGTLALAHERHQRIVDTICDGDPEAAAQAMLDDLTDTRDALTVLIRPS
ncbi:FadR/GntR family transcriptional regulator [Amycolatopsis sp. CA-230715]|uniref:FadR/GntR family transcriptional regulator n=1 Tax=Amycolatopsis sp. CA-230715 TaxID=2745196 RepID=UPI001C00B1C2|nr:FCD domain-containing protein [Amycolatopsis sp. CA-230715]QWF79774.1 HTH-type transcriptional regulator LutR [Amycolatopsis sp. CA-230715]